MAAKFPHHYTVNLSWTGGSIGQATSNENAPLPVGPPPQFDGTGDVWSPEDLFLASIQSCLMTTFFSLTTRRKIEIQQFKSDISGTLEKTKEGITFTEIQADIFVQADEKDQENIEKVIKLTEKYCIISNVLKFRPTVNLHFT